LPKDPQAQRRQYSQEGEASPSLQPCFARLTLPPLRGVPPPVTPPALYPGPVGLIYDRRNT
jgi:hypothetical protein